MTGQQRALRWLAAGVLVFWCGVFLRAENTEKSMVRALILTPPTVAGAELDGEPALPVSGSRRRCL